MLIDQNVSLLPRLAGSRRLPSSCSASQHVPVLWIRTEGKTERGRDGERNREREGEKHREGGRERGREGGWD